MKKSALIFIGFLAFSACQSSLDDKQPNVRDLADREEFIYVPSDTSKEKFLKRLEASDVLNDIESFMRVAEKRNLYQRWKPGKFRLLGHYTNRQICELLINGTPELVTVKFPFAFNSGQIARRITKYIEPDSAQLQAAFTDSSIIRKLKNYTHHEDVLPLFSVDSVVILWNCKPIEILLKADSLYGKFWNTERLHRADSIGLSPYQVSILASIVRSEQRQYPDEWPVIAGLYMNRLKTGMPLQSDPTIIFAHGDFKMKRVLNSHLEIESPFNTYKYAGLPPKCIAVPSAGAIDAVLNYEKHKFIYMCAKEDLSGRHNFAQNFSQHQRNAKAYQKAITKKGIK